jgi:DNA-binding MarR family transcriptional regulator
MTVNISSDTVVAVRHQQSDSVDRITSQWNAVRPDVDVSPIEVIGRVSRLSRLIDRRLAENFARFDLENWMYDVLATLRRSGEPYVLTAGDLMRDTMVTTGAVTNRIDRLEQRGLVERATSSDRRKVMVRLTEHGLDTVDEVVTSHMATEREILGSLSLRQQHDLAKVLRTVLLGLGDHPPVEREAR